MLSLMKQFFTQKKSTMNDKINLNDLLANQNQEDQGNNFAQLVQRNQQKKVKNLSRKQQQMMRRQTNYEMVKEDMDKWVGIIKVNREKDCLNFQQKDQNSTNLNFFPSKPLNDFHKKIDSHLANMNLQSQNAVMKEEKSILGSLSEEQAKRRLAEARKHKQTAFQLEQKRKRIAKIKSKLYRKIKKKQRLRQQAKRFDQMDHEEKVEMVEKLTKRRIQERINQRHHSKNKHIQNLMRYSKNSKNSIQQTINEVNQQRKKELQKVDQELLDEISEEYDDQNFREQAMKDIEEQIDAIENENVMEGQMDGLSDLKFIKSAKEKKRREDKKEAKKLLDKLANQDQIIDEDSSESKQKEESQPEGEVGRKVYGKNLVQKQGKTSEMKGNRTMQQKLKEYLNYQEPEALTSGIDLQKLKQKYQPERVNIDLTKLIAENNELYQQDNEAVRENLREFNQQKMAEYEEIAEGQTKNQGNMKGWGSWAGPGVRQKKIDPKEELKKKLRKIEEIKKKRKDGQLSHITINQDRNKNLSEYLVRDLPRQYSNADQFDYLQNTQIGPEWNTLNQFKDNIKPKVLKKTGQVIKPVQLPKNMNKK